MGMRISIVQSARHIDRKPTPEQPYLLDQLYFGATKDNTIVAVEGEKTEEGKIPVFKDVVSGKEYGANNFYCLETRDIYNPDEIKRLDGFDIQKYLKNVTFRGLFSGKVYRNLKTYDAFNFPEGSPRMGYRASKEQVVALVKDIQKGYNIELEKQQQPGK